MPSVAALLAFGLAVTPLVLTPGASFTLVSARGLAGDRRGGWATIGGTAAGIWTHALLAGVGLAAVVMRSAEAYRVFRLVGALYLVCLGMSLIWRGRRTSDLVADDATPDRGSIARQLWRAYVANVLNVKAASVYLTLAPQFLGPTGVGMWSMAALAGVHVLVMTVWLGLWTIGLTSLAAGLHLRRWARRITTTGGVVLVALGVRGARSAAA